MIKVILANKFWTKYGDNNMSVDFIGYIDFENYLFLTAKDFYKFLEKRMLTESSILKFLAERFLNNTNGNFAIILRFHKKYILICDFARTYPLYIISENTMITVTDHIGDIQFLREPDHLAMEEFLLSGLVTGHRTVYKNIKGLQAGEMSIVNDLKIEFYRYFILRSEPFGLNKVLDYKAIYREMDNLFLTVFDRMIKSCPDVKNWIVPLSGGHDSRLIINYLFKLGCANVICFTYGESSSKEAVISRLAAESLGYKWYFVEYTSKEWQKLHDKRLFDGYIKYSFNGCCLPHVQDLLAIYKLKEMSLINDKDVVVPGHTAFTEAENLKVKEFSSEKQSFKYVYNRYYNLFDCKNNFHKFELSLKELCEEGGQDIYSFPEFFNWQERQAKFINNSLRVYEYCDLKWRIPFWEKRVIDLWQNIKFEERVKRKILFIACEEYLLNNALKNIPFINKFNKPTSPESIIFKILPDRLISYLVRIKKKKSIIAEGTNLVFVHKSQYFSDIIGPLKKYPLNIKKYIRAVLPRRSYQVDSNAIMAVYTLRNEVLS